VSTIRWHREKTAAHQKEINFVDFKLLTPPPPSSSSASSSSRTSIKLTMRLAPLLAIAATAAAHRTKPNSSSSLAVGAKQNKKHGKRNNEKGREKHLNNPISVLAHEIEKVTKSDKDDKEGDIPELADQHDVALIESMNPTYQPSPEELEFASINVDTSQSPSVSPKMLVEQPTEAKDTMLTSPTETQSMDGGEPALPCPPGMFSGAAHCFLASY
jgi:hypothetical protein